MEEIQNIPVNLILKQNRNALRTGEWTDKSTGIIIVPHDPEKNSYKKQATDSE